jgi:EmrB/QacA subfamily drug resistance transporter
MTSTDRSPASRPTTGPDTTGDKVTSTSAPTEPAPTPPVGRLDSAVLRIAGVVVLGTLMSVLDTTVVNVALQNLTIQFNTSFDTIQWVVTGYSLALAMVIPITAWAAFRYGTKRLYLLSIVGFLLGSVLAGLAWNVESLITFRILQGLGGGVLMPAGMMIVARAAGPQRMGSVMSVLGVPMLLGPIAGPILGGWLLDAANWRWIFFINVPIGLIALYFAGRVLRRDEPGPRIPFDFLGMLMLSPGLALLILGVSKIPSEGSVTPVVVWLPGLAGLGLVIAFVLRAVRIQYPLVDLKLFKNRVFAIGVVTSTLFSIVFMGAALLFPTYFLLVRGESVLNAGLLLASNGIGALLTMPLAGRLTDRFQARWVVVTGLVLIAAGTVAFTFIKADTSYALLIAALFVMGLGMGATFMPITSAALVTLSREEVPVASAAMNIVQRIAGAIGSALFSTVLATSLAGKFGVPTSRGQVTATQAMHGPDAVHAATLASDAFATAFAWALVLILICLVPAVFLPARRRPTS